MSEYEAKRLQRKRALARQEARQFEDQLSQHELILRRLDALPEELQETNHEEAREAAISGISRLRTMVDIMHEEAGPEEHESRQVRRAAAREAAKS